MQKKKKISHNRLFTWRALLVMSPNRWLRQLAARPLNPLQSASESLTKDLLHAAKRSRRPNAEAIGASQHVTTSSSQEQHRGAIGAGMLGKGPRHSRSLLLCRDRGLCLAPASASLAWRTAEAMG